jgi:uncharacterized protein
VLRRARVPIEEIEEVVEVAPAPRLAREHAFGPIPRPSFNCRYAKTAVERAICADPVLAAKDRRMALLYERAGGSRYRPVDPAQWSWLAARNRCGRTRGPALERCLHAALSGQLLRLQHLAARAYIRDEFPIAPVRGAAKAPGAADAQQPASRYRSMRPCLNSC